jgi:hypothetical protein
VCSSRLKALATASMPCGFGRLYVREGRDDRLSTPSIDTAAVSDLYLQQHYCCIPLAKRGSAVRIPCTQLL